MWLQSHICGKKNLISGKTCKKDGNNFKKYANKNYKHFTHYDMEQAIDGWQKEAAK